MQINFLFTVSTNVTLSSLLPRMLWLLCFSFILLYYLHFMLVKMTPIIFQPIHSWVTCVLKGYLFTAECIVSSKGTHSWLSALLSSKGTHSLLSELCLQRVPIHSWVNCCLQSVPIHGWTNCVLKLVKGYPFTAEWTVSSKGIHSQLSELCPQRVPIYSWVNCVLKLSQKVPIHSWVNCCPQRVPIHS